MKHIFFVLLTLLPTAFLSAQDAASTSLFDGKTLDGWHNPYEWGETTVKDGEIHLVAQRKFFLMSDREYGDYVFEGEVFLPEGKSNSGFMVRGQEAKNRVFGYQAEADPTARAWSGGLYDEGRRQWLNPLSDQPEAQKAFKLGEWNRYKIVAEGDHLQFFVNDVPTTDYYDPVDLKGRIGLQHHGEKDQLYRFRNLRVQDNGQSIWKPLFNGKDLTGWKAIGGGQWSVEDGVLVGKSPASEPKHGLLISDQSYGDFTAKIVFRITSGNSGFYFHSQAVDQAVGIRGVQAELENSDAVGGLYETGGRGWIAKPLGYFDSFSQDRQAGRKKQWAKVLDGLTPENWTTMVVSVHGDRIVTHVGDILACDIRDAKVAQQGHFALQLHGGQDMHVEIQSVELLEKQPKH